MLYVTSYLGFLFGKNNEHILYHHNTLNELSYSKIKVIETKLNGNSRNCSYKFVDLLNIWLGLKNYPFRCDENQADIAVDLTSFVTRMNYNRENNINKCCNIYLLEKRSGELYETISKYYLYKHKDNISALKRDSRLTTMDNTHNTQSVNYIIQRNNNTLKSLFVKCSYNKEY